MFLFGLTGGIGSGKSSVSERLAARGAVVVDADRIVRELQAPEMPVFVAMVEHFGERIVAADGSLDRQAVADIVFNDADELAALGEIVHPAVRDEIARRVVEQAERDNIVILDIPLLAESGWENLLGTIVVDLDPDEAVRRLVEFRGFSEADARARIAQQASRAERLTGASFVVDNSGSLTELDAEVDRLWEWLSAHRVTEFQSAEG